MKRKSFFLLLWAILSSYCAFSQKVGFFPDVSQKNSQGDGVVLVKGQLSALQSTASKANGRFAYSIGEFHAFRIPAEKRDVFLKDPSVESVFFYGGKPQQLNDTMRIRNRVDSVLVGYAPLHSPYSGKGVIVAIIDTGVDFLHPDFQDSLGNTRLLRIWDQSQPVDPNRTPTEYGYGQVWDSTDINAGICTSQDVQAHGTTVAGCTSGNARANGRHMGVAPDSWLIAVKSNLYAANWELTIADAVDYCFRVADTLQMPVVVNLSLGNYYGSHDGKDPAALFIDSLIRAKDGRLVVCAAGNSGNSSLYGNYHLETQVTSDTSFTWFTEVAAVQSSLGYDAVFFEVWADTNDFKYVRFAVGADVPGPNWQFRGNTPFHSIADFPEATLLTDTLYSFSGNSLAVVDYWYQYYEDAVQFQVHLKEADSSQNYFRFMTTGTGRFDVWSASWTGTSDMINAGLPTPAELADITQYSYPDSAKVIVSSFTCLESVITVGNYNNRLTYIDYSGNLQSFAGNAGDISVNSSRGPTRDNRLKPEVAASGDLTMSAGALATLAWQQVNEPFKVDQGGMHMRNGGTSMASPVVAGIGALLLEKCPNTSWLDFRQQLMAGTFTDNFTGSVPNITWGNGKVSAFQTLVNSLFDPQLSAAPFCEGDSSQISVSSPHLSQIWMNGDTSSAWWTSDSVVVWATVSNQQGCRENTDTLLVPALPVPAKPLIISDLSGQPLLFASDVSASSYEWYSGSGPYNVNDSTLQVFISGSNFIVLEVFNDFGCSTLSDTLNFSVSSIEEVDGGLLVIYPNPIREGELLQMASTFPSALQLVMTDALGRIVWMGDLSGEKLTIDLNHLTPGIYWLDAREDQNGKHRTTLKLIRL